MKLKTFALLMLSGAFMLASAEDFILKFNREPVKVDPAKGIYAGRAKGSSLEGKDCIDASYKSWFRALKIKTPDCIKGDEGSISFYFMPTMPIPEKTKLQMHSLIISENRGKGGVHLGINIYNKNSIYPFLMFSDTAKKVRSHGPYEKYALKINVWQKIVVSWDKKMMYMTIDGNLVGSRPAKCAPMWGEYLFIGGRTYPGFEAGGYINDIRFSAKPIPFSGKMPLEVKPLKSNARTEYQQIHDQAGNYTFRYESPDSKVRATIAPAVFKFKKGDLLWVEQTGGISGETVAVKDNELTIELDTSLFNQVSISRTVPDMMKGRKFTICKLNSRIPYNGIDGGAERLSIDPVWTENGKEIASGLTGGFILKNDADGKSVVARSEKITVLPGTTYLAQVTFRTNTLRAGNGFIATAVIGEKASRKIRFAYCEVFRRNDMEKGHTLSYRIVVPKDFKEPFVSLIFAVGGAPVEIGLSGFDLRPEPYRYYKLPRPLTPDQTRAVISGAEVKKLLAARTRRKIGKVKENGRVALTVDGKVVPHLIYYAFPNQRGCKEFYQSGVKIHNVYTLSADGYTRFWLGSGKYDFRALDEHLLKVLTMAPDAVITLSLGCNPYYGFSAQYPDAVTRNEKGEKMLYIFRKGVETPASRYMVCYASGDYIRETSHMLRALCRHLKVSPLGKAVSGIHIIGGWDGQWFPAHFVDRAPDSLKAYRKYLAKYYNNDLAAFRKAWGDGKVTFETAQFVPYMSRETSPFLLDPAKPADRKAMDMFRYRGEYPADMLIAFGKTIKEEMGRDFWVNAYYCDTKAGHDLGTESLLKLLDSGMVDGISSCIPYGDYRLTGEPGAIQSQTGSINLHNGKMLAELDYRNEYSDFAQRGGPGRTEQAIGASRGHEDHLNMLRRDLGMVLTSGQGAWFYSLAGLTWADEVFQRHINHAVKAAERSANDPRKETAQMAVFTENKSYYYSRSGLFSYRLSDVSGRNIMWTLNTSGVSYDSYALDDVVHKERPAYKINLFMRAPALTEKEIDYIRKNMQKDGNVLIFTFDTGRLSKEGFSATLKKLTGIDAVLHPATPELYRHAPGKVAGIGKTLDFLQLNITAPLIEITDKEATALAYYMKRPGVVAAAMKKHANWTAVFIACPGGVTTGFLREAAKLAGLKPGTAAAGDSFFAGNGMMMIHAITSGRKTLQWDGKCDLIDPESGKTVIKNSDSISFDMKVGETRYFFKTK